MIPKAYPIIVRHEFHLLLKLSNFFRMNLIPINPVPSKHHPVYSTNSVYVCVCVSVALLSGEGALTAFDRNNICIH